MSAENIMAANEGMNRPAIGCKYTTNRTKEAAAEAYSRSLFSLRIAAIPTMDIITGIK